jgi:hypothetical protein
VRSIGILLIVLTLIASTVGCGQLAHELTTDSAEATADQVNCEYTTSAFSSCEDLLSNDKIEMMLMDSPPTPPTNVSRAVVNVDSLTAGAVILNDVPTSEWTYGCTATSAGMLFGYYDRTGYPNMYTGSAGGGVCPLTDLGQGYPSNPGYPISGSCYIIATENGLDGIGSNAHVDDYWISYGSAGPDPWEGNWAEHTWGLCTADFLGTNQWKWDYSSYPGTDGTKDTNTDGSTTVWNYNNGSKLYDWYPGSTYGLPATSCCHGMKLFAESRGYTVETNYNQLTDNQNSNGFTFAEFQAEIDAGRPVLIHVVGHTMIGIGYDAATTSIYLHDTWDNSVHSMTWGGSYAGMGLYAVTVIHIAAPTEYSLTISSTPGGSVTIPGEGTFTRAEGTVVDLVAILDEGYQFGEWTGDVGTIADVYAATTTITMDGNYSITASFCEIPIISLGFNGVEAGPHAEFDYCEGVNLTVTLFEEYAGQAPYTITWTVAENCTLDGMATVGKADTLFSHVLDAGVYTLRVTSVVDANGCEAEEAFLETCQATVTVHERSTYQFIYDVLEHIVACEDAEMTVTFQTDVQGFCGYDNVRYEFQADGPGDVTLKATDPEEVEHTFVNSGYWELGTGSDLPADYFATTDWSLNFSEPGEYTITFSLIEAPNGGVIAGIEGSEIITVRAVDIMDYYRHLNEPYDEITTLDLLAAIDDWLADATPPGFDEPIGTLELLALIDEWLAAG